MAQQPPRDFADRIARLEDRIRRLELRVRGKGGNKTFVIAFPITIGMSIPPIDLAVGAPDDTIPETLEIVGFRAKLLAGTCDLSWWQDGSEITGSTLSVTTAWSSTVPLDPTIPVDDGTELLLSVDAASSDAVNLTATVLLASRVS